MMAFIGAIIVALILFGGAWYVDAKKCHEKGWDFNFAGQCYDKDGYLRKP